MAWRIVREVDTASSESSTQAAENTAHNGLTQTISNTAGSTNGAGTGMRGEEEEQEERDAVFYRLEMLGYRVGQGLVERFVFLSHLFFPISPFIRSQFLHPLSLYESCSRRY